MPDRDQNKSLTARGKTEPERRRAKSDAAGGCLPEAPCTVLIYSTARRLSAFRNRVRIRAVVAPGIGAALRRGYLFAEHARGVVPLERLGVIARNAGDALVVDLAKALGRLAVARDRGARVDLDRVSALTAPLERESLPEQGIAADLDFGLFRGCARFRDLAPRFCPRPLRGGSLRAARFLDLTLRRLDLLQHLGDFRLLLRVLGGEECVSAHRHDERSGRDRHDQRRRAPPRGARGRDFGFAALQFLFLFREPGERLGFAARRFLEFLARLDAGRLLGGAAQLGDLALGERSVDSVRKLLHVKLEILGVVAFLDRTPEFELELLVAGIRS